MIITSENYYILLMLNMDNIFISLILLHKYIPKKNQKTVFALQLFLKCIPVFAKFHVFFVLFYFIHATYNVTL